MQRSCVAFTKRGYQCKIPARSGGQYCSKHIAQREQRGGSVPHYPFISGPPGDLEEDNPDFQTRIDVTGDMLRVANPYKTYLQVDNVGYVSLRYVLDNFNFEQMRASFLDEVAGDEEAVNLVNGVVDIYQLLAMCTMNVNYVWLDMYFPLDPEAEVDEVKTYMVFTAGHIHVPNPAMFV